MKHKIIFFLVAIAISINCFSQNLDRTISVAANEVAQKIIKKNRNRIAVADFVNNAGKSDPLAQYITKQFELGLINAEGDVQIMDRNHINKLLSDNHLQSAGLIDESTAKSAVSFIKVDGWAFGEVTTFGEQVKISVKIIDVATSLIYAAYTSDLISDPLIAKLTRSTEEQGGNRECDKKNVGSFIFANKGPNAIRDANPYTVTLVDAANKRYEISVPSGEEGTFYNVPAGIYTYYIKYLLRGRSEAPVIMNSFSGPLPAVQYANYSGQISVEKCKTKRYDCKW